MADFFPDFESRYHALEIRDPAAEGKFVYAVISTGIVCRPTCSSRLALAKNIVFFDTVGHAVRNGFRPCKRCRPEVVTCWNNTRNCVSRACAVIAQWASAGKKLDVDLLATLVGLSKWHFCRVFKKYTDCTPRKFHLLACQGQLRGKTLPLVVTKRFSERSKKASVDDGIVAEILRYCQENVDADPAPREADSGSYSGPPDLDELDWLLDPKFLERYTLPNFDSATTAPAS